MGVARDKVSSAPLNHNLDPAATRLTPRVTILWPWYHRLAKTIPFQELGEAFLDQQASKRTTTNLVRRLNNLGYDVLLRPKVAA